MTVASSPETSKRVLVIRIGRLGDTIMATPVIEALQNAYDTDVLIDFAASPGASTFLLELDKRVNRVFSIAHRRVPWRLHSVKRELEKLSRRQPYDLVINLECGTECDDFIRFVHSHEFCGRPLIEPRHQPDRHCVDTEKSIYAQRLGPDITMAAESSLQLQMETQTLPVVQETDYVVINPGFSGLQIPGYRSHRRWPDDHWHRLVDLLTRQSDLQVLVNGTNDERPCYEALLKQDGVHSLFGSSLQVLATALTNARGLISVDTGTVHLAMALGTPTVALLGPSNPMLTGPYSRKVPKQVLVKGLDCQPCVGSVEQKQCSFNRCMSDLGPEQVFASCQHIFQREARQRTETD